MILSKNILIEWQGDDQKPRVDRILHISPAATDVVTIQIAAERVMPILRSYEEVISAIQTGGARVLQDDPYGALLRPDREFSESQLKRRDELWALITPLVSDDVEFLIYSHKRGPKITALAKSQRRHKKVIYDALRRFWQAGQNKNGLIPNFDKSGGRGKRRLVDEQDGCKFGRPASLEKKLETRIGIKITPDVGGSKHFV